MTVCCKMSLEIHWEIPVLRNIWDWNLWKLAVASSRNSSTVNLCTKILDFRWFDSNIILVLRGGIPRPAGNFPEISSQQILAGRFLVGRSGIIHGDIYISLSLSLSIYIYIERDIYIERERYTYIRIYIYIYVYTCTYTHICIGRFLLSREIVRSSDAGAGPSWSDRTGHRSPRTRPRESN